MLPCGRGSREEQVSSPGEAAEMHIPSSLDLLNPKLQNSAWDSAFSGLPTGVRMRLIPPHFCNSSLWAGLAQAQALYVMEKLSHF